MPPAAEPDMYQVIADNAIPDGHNQVRVKQIRKHFQEKHPELVKNLLWSNVFVDFIVNVLPCPVGLIYFGTKEWDFTQPLTYLYAFLFCWLWAAQLQVYHDLTHRMPFGQFWTRVLAKLAAPGAAGVGEAWYKRHRHHHAMAGERNDPKMTRFVRYDGPRLERNPYVRLMSFFIPGYQAYLHFHAISEALERFEGKIKVVWGWRVYERIVGFIFIGGAMYFLGLEAIGKRFVTLIIFLGPWDSNRMLMEHGAQDIKDDWAQATFYNSGWFTRFLYWWVPSADLHHIHHTWPKAPNYCIQWYGKLCMPEMRKLGCTFYDSYWDLWWQYYVVNKPYQSDFSVDMKKKA